ncbi:MULTISPECIES: peptidoglycan-binding domain-containing protein [unclassified Streptomyces]|uniref:peptidoglycan-binding domain-containing protein n=1 Tax=unclassified Streptomyces TaxID=2593676 RepID=UPI000DDA76E0|nr:MULTISPECIES: peptidoglycan-binding domain-containing protein [unclassified Streptomyces]QZZ31719.1 peptidoglycan-binding protein [Streptomyces sp. ST1015]
MRPKTLSRTLVGAATAAAIAVGSLAGASAGFAAPAQETKAASSTEARILATVNLGLSQAEARKVQNALAARWRYTGDIDGLLGTESWMAMQRFLKEHYGYTDGIDGIVGTHTVEALQRYLKRFYGYEDRIDGDPGPNTRAAFKRMAAVCPGGCLLT